MGDLSATPRPTPPEERELIFTVSRTPYLLGAALFLASLVMIAAVAISSPKSAWAPVLAAVFLLPIGLRSLRALRGPRRYRLISEALELLWEAKSESVPLEEITDIQPATSDARASRSCTVHVSTKRRSVAIPRWTSPGSGRFLAALARRTDLAHARVHAVRLGEEIRHRYADAPQEIADILRDLRGEGTEKSALLFRGHAAKRQGCFLSIRWFFGWLTVLGVGLALSGAAHNEDMMFAGIGFAMLGVIIFLLTLIPLLQRRSRNEWLLVHSNGIALVGKVLTGELSWEEVANISKTRARSFALSGEGAPASPTGRIFTLETQDGAKIPIHDIYDAPVSCIERACALFYRRRDSAE